VVAPTKCPSCGAKVEKEDDTPYIRCVNPACPAQLRERLLWYVGRGQMYVEGLGESIVDQLIAEGSFIPSRICTSSPNRRLRTSPARNDQGGKTITRRVGEKTAAKIVANIESTARWGWIG